MLHSNTDAGRPLRFHEALHRHNIHLLWFFIPAGMGRGTRKTREKPKGAYWLGSTDSIKVKCRVIRDAKELINATLTHLTFSGTRFGRDGLKGVIRVRRCLLFSGTWNLVASPLQSYSTNQNKCFFVCLFVYNCVGRKLGAVIVRSMAYSLLLFHPL